METPRMALAPSSALLGCRRARSSRRRSLLVAGVEALDRGGDAGVDVVHGLLDGLAEVVGLVAVAEFDGLVLAGGGAGGDGGAADAPWINPNWPGT
jgi:hypothetical protein